MSGLYYIDIGVLIATTARQLSPGPNGMAPSRHHLVANCMNTTDNRVLKLCQKSLQIARQM